MAYIEILGVRHAYELTTPTTNPYTLVFIHGWLLSRSYWQPVIERLAPTYQCLAYDLRGFGESQINPNLSHGVALESTSRYTPVAYAQDLAVLLEQLNLADVWLIGHSLGGTIALWGAERLPEYVKGVICVNAGGGIYLKEAFEQFRSVGQRLIKLRPHWLGHVPLIDLLFTRASVAHPIARCWGRQRVIDFVQAAHDAALGALLDSTTEEEVNRLPQVVSDLKQPVYFLTGALDPIMEPKYVRHLASFHPLFESCGNNVMEIPQCGHMAMVEQPDAVAHQICTILNRHGE